jgi:hypothetical protein
MVIGEPPRWDARRGSGHGRGRADLHRHCRSRSRPCPRRRGMRLPRGEGPGVRSASVIDALIDGGVTLDGCRSATSALPRRSLGVCPSPRRMQGNSQGDRNCGSGFITTRPRAKPSSMTTSRQHISGAGDTTLAPLSWKRTWSGSTTRRKMSGTSPIRGSCGP